MVLLILFMLTAIIYSMSMVSYWCISRKFGVIGFFITCVYLTIISYLNIMNQYLFEQAFGFPSLAVAIFVLVIAAAIFIDRMIFIDRKLQVGFTIIIMLADIILCIYAHVVSSWHAVSADTFRQTCQICTFCIGTLAGYLFETSYIRFSTKCFYIYEQFIKFIAGIFIFALATYLAYIFSNITLIALLLITFASFWTTGLYPVIIRKIQRHEYSHR